MRRLLAVVVIGVLALTGCHQASHTYPPHLPPTIITFTEPDLTNPLRGQYQNLATRLFPQADPAQERYPDWPATTDTSIRIDWRTLQPQDPRRIPAGARDDQKYDFTAIDSALAHAADTGGRVGLRVTAFNSCCETRYPNNTDIAVPDWLRTVANATHVYRNAGVDYVIPDWNNKDYLSYFTALLAALGRRYDRDERLSMFEMSGYGDFSENHVAFMRDTLKLPGPSPEHSQGQLGYFSQYRDQFINRDAVATLVNANLSAFPNTWLVTATGNPEITRQLFRDSPLLPARAKPVGIRADGLGAFGVIPTWAENRYSRYVQIRDPLINVVVNRFRTAPIITEWIPDPPTPTDPGEYYRNGLRDIVNSHVSMTASTGFPAQLSGTTMPPEQYELWSRANTFSGYRYAVLALDTPANVSTSTRFPITLRWTNFGVAPSYERWDPRYEIVASSGEVVRTLGVGFDLGGLVAEQHFDASRNDTPTAKSTLDRITIAPGLPSGSYLLRVRVEWNEHKPKATTKVDFPPMQLAQSGRDADGGYPVARFTVR